VPAPGPLPRCRPRRRCRSRRARGPDGGALQAAAQRRHAAEAAGRLVRAGAGLLPAAAAARHDGARGAGRAALRQPPPPAYPLLPAPLPAPGPAPGPAACSRPCFCSVRESLTLAQGSCRWRPFRWCWRSSANKVLKNGLTNSVFTLYELTSGDDTENEEFHGLDESMLLRALQALQQEHKAEIITLDDGRGVKFF
uniref:Vacuolar protein-sorting-associated protein 25 n=1 Tax=Apteryx owenii TaxID=8824 RepID=A0A8B9S7L6_APTOW